MPPAWTDVWIASTTTVTSKPPAATRAAEAVPVSRRSAPTAKRRSSRTSTIRLVLPGYPQQVAIDLAAPGIPREKVVAAVVRLLEATLVRVGNEEYARVMSPTA